MNKESLYMKLPFVFQKFILNVKGYIIKSTRFNKKFICYLSNYHESDNKKVDNNQFYKFLKEAQRTEFWRNRFVQFNVNIENTTDLVSEIKKMPIITKSEVKKNIDLIINYNQKDIIWVHTSGTTGSGLAFPATREMENKQWAIWWRYRELNGINFGTWMGWFGGKSILDVERVKPPFWIVNKPLKQIMFSAHHLNKITAKDYFVQIKKRKITWLHGYPSQLSWLAKLIEDQNLGTLPDVKYVTVGAENLLESQKQIMEKVFRAKIIQHYGLAEGVANISEHHDGHLRADYDFALTEFIPVDNKNPTICKIIGTNYNNTAFPLIRYDTSDLASIRWENDGTPSITSIDGRQDDYITLPNGVKIARLGHIFKNLTEISEAQIYQPDFKKIILRVVKGKEYDSKGQEKQLLFETRKRVGNEIQIAIEYFDQIPKTKSGKLKFVISDIKD